MKKCIYYFCLILALGYSLCIHSESYTLNVGESITISQMAYSGGYIDKVGLGDYIDPHLTFTDNQDGTVTISVQSYFDYNATVKLVFIERYQSYYNGRFHTLAHTYYKDVDIKCYFQQQEQSVKPTKVLLPERIRVSIYDSGFYVTPILMPNGAKGTKYTWSNLQESAAFSAQPTNDGKCFIKGRSPGIGHLSVVVNDDWDNLYASSVIEVIDPAYPPPSSVFLPSEIEISVNGTSTLTPILIPEDASTSFIWESEDASIATVAYGKVIGKKIGTTIVKLRTKNNLTTTCTIKVVSSNGKDDEEISDNYTYGMIDGHDYVDLGLKVKWATSNVGASCPESYGDYYAWGEIAMKSSYTWSTYIYLNSSTRKTYSIGSDIKGTSYDAAYIKWGSNWRMPTSDEVSELISKCTFKQKTLNGIDGFIVTGPNGNSIFLPEAGYMDSKKYKGCRYWTSINDTENAISLLISKSKPTLQSRPRYWGLPIRAVTTANGISSDEAALVTLPTSTSIYIGETITLPTTVYPSNANTTFTWSSDDTSIATVSTSGVIEGIKEGNTKIRVQTSSNKSDYCIITVKKVTGVEINVTNFPDDNFRNYLLSQNYGTDGILTNEEIAEIKVISVSGQNIKTLKGIEFFTALTYLYCDHNQLTSLDLSMNTVLTELDCSSNQLSVLDLTRNTKMTILYCYCNQLNEAAMDELIASLPTIKSKELHVVFNENEGNVINTSQVTAAKLKGWNPKYTVNGINWLDYDSSEPIQESIAINEINFPDANFRKYLLSRNFGADGVVTYEEIAEIEDINLYDEKIKSLKGIEFFTAMKRLICSLDGLLTSLDISKNKVLEELTCYHNKLTSLDVSKNHWLVELNCSDNQLTSLDVSNNPMLKELNCGGNKLVSLDVSNNSMLKTLDCRNNKLTTLDVSNNTAIETLACQGNSLTSLDLSNNMAIHYLYIYQNNIKGLKMNALVNSLPQKLGLKMYAIYYNNEGNIMTTTQVSVAKAKGWTPYYFYNYYNSYLDEYYDQSDPYAGIKTNYTIGDANSDGKIGMPDVMFTMNYILGTPDHSFNAEAADANLDGKVNLPDIMFILNYIKNGKFPDE